MIGNVYDYSQFQLNTVQTIKPNAGQEDTTMQH